MAKLSKRMRAIAEKVDAEKAYSIEEAVRPSQRAVQGEIQRIL